MVNDCVARMMMLVGVILLLMLSKKTKKVQYNKLKKRFLWSSILFIVIFFVASLKYTSLQTSLAFKNPEGTVNPQKALLPPASIDPEIVTHGDRTQKIVALTFDADMTNDMVSMLKNGQVSSWYNEDVTKTLIANNAKATIFLTGLWTKVYPAQAKMLASNPLFEIGNHSYSHPSFTPQCYGLPSIPDSEDKNQIQTTQEIIKHTIGFYPKYFRFPGGCYDKTDLAVVTSYGLKVVHWDVISGDSYLKDPELIVKQTESLVQNGSIIVFHISGGPFAPATNDALVKIIPWLKQQGYQFVTISELLSYN